MGYSLPLPNFLLTKFYENSKYTFIIYKSQRDTILLNLYI